MKKKIVTYLLVASMLTVTNGCGNTVKEATTETGTEEASEETSVEASSEQSTEETAEPIAEKQNKPEINEDLLGAIEQLADGQEQAVSGTEHSFYGWYSDEYLEGEWIWPQIDRSADDILEKFRASRPVKYPDSIYGEGDVLGR